MKLFASHRSAGTCVVAALLLLAPPGRTRAAEPARPNVLFIMADDLNKTRLLRQPLVQTPNTSACQARRPLRSRLLQTPLRPEPENSCSRPDQQ